MTREGKTELVVVGVDGSPASEAALAWAARYAEAIGARLRAVLAWHYPSAAGGPPAGVAPASVTSEVEQSRYEILDKAIAAPCGDEPTLRLAGKLFYGPPAQALISESQQPSFLSVP